MRPNPTTQTRRRRRRAFLTAGLVASIHTCGLAAPKDARAQACCVGASGLTPGWLANHEQWLVGAQLRLAGTHGTYPTRGSFYEAPVGRDARIESSLFATARVLQRGQVSVFAPLATVRRRAGDIVETRTSLGDLTLVGRYDVIRPGESRVPGIALLAGGVFPTGTPSDRASPRLAADASGTGAWEGNAGLSVEQVYGKVVLHATALFGLRAPREVLGVTQTLGPRALYLFASGYVFDGDVAVLGTITHTSDGDATVGGVEAPGTGFRATQLAMLVVVPISDTVRIRTSAFTDVPPLGNNRQALGGTSVSLLKSWF
jgi:hypothetical protein